MVRAGFHVHAELTPLEDTVRDWDLDNNNAQWDDDTRQQRGLDTCTLTYTEAAVNPTPLQFDLIAEITIILPTEGDLMSKVKKTVENGKIYYKAATTRYEGLLSALDQPVNFEDSQLENFQAVEEFKLGPWVSGSASKKKRTGPKLMSNMVLKPSMPVATRKTPVVRVSETPRQGGLIRSVRQVLDLGKKIKGLNEDITVNPQLRIVLPQACELSSSVFSTSSSSSFSSYNDFLTSILAQIVRPSGRLNAPGRQYTLGPTEANFHAMMRGILLNQWALDGAGQLDRPRTTNYIDGDTVNRSSIVTMFERHDTLNTTGTENAAFSMLFTGDAYDAQCDVRDTLLRWQADTAPPTIQVDVLKVRPKLCLYN